MSMRRLAVVLGAALVVALAGLACGGPSDDTTSFGDPCDDASQCREDAPTCVGIEAADYAPGICASACAEPADCPGGSECRAGACIRCVASIAGSIAAGGDCGCDADCEGVATCDAGICTGGETDCTVTPCPSGFSCDGAPPACRECLGTSGSAEGEPCGCNADCGSGLECLGDLCARACTIDEMCGADECRHEFAVGPSCFAIDPACVFAGDVAAGGDCLCNGDCVASAPLCIGVFLGGEPTSFCSAACSLEQPCPGGTRCCSIDARHPYCVSQEIADTVGATCL